MTTQTSPEIRDPDVQDLLAHLKRGAHLRVMRGLANRKPFTIYPCLHKRVGETTRTTEDAYKALDQDGQLELVKYTDVFEDYILKLK